LGIKNFNCEESFKVKSSGYEQIKYTYKDLYMLVALSLFPVYEQRLQDNLQITPAREEDKMAFRPQGQLTQLEFLLC